MYFYNMIEIIIIGTGNVGKHLCHAFEKDTFSNKIKLKGYYNRSQTRFTDINAGLLTDINKLPPCDLIFLCVPDNAVENMGLQLPNSNSIIAHTSGSVPMNILNKHKNYGVFYMPQSFSTSREPNFEEIPICLESSNSFVNEVLEKVASTLSRKREQINSKQRKSLHLAAVYINNFVNHCYYKAGAIMEEAFMDRNLLDALMRETLKKAIDLSPENAQTGPAIRNDSQTIETHINMLDKDDQEMYRSITKSIQTTHGKKL